MSAQIEARRPRRCRHSAKLTAWNCCSGITTTTTAAIADTHTGHVSVVVEEQGTAAAAAVSVSPTLPFSPLSSLLSHHLPAWSSLHCSRVRRRCRERKSLREGLQRRRRRTPTANPVGVSQSVSPHQPVLPVRGAYHFASAHIFFQLAATAAAAAASVFSATTTINTVLDSVRCVHETATLVAVFGSQFSEPSSSHILLLPDHRYHFPPLFFFTVTVIWCSIFCWCHPLLPPPYSLHRHRLHSLFPSQEVCFVLFCFASLFFLSFISSRQDRLDKKPGVKCHLWPCALSSLESLCVFVLVIVVSVVIAQSDTRALLFFQLSISTRASKSSIIIIISRSRSTNVCQRPLLLLCCHLPLSSFPSSSSRVVCVCVCCT